MQVVPLDFFRGCVAGVLFMLGIIFLLLYIGNKMNERFRIYKGG